jgi:hypothetical protein
MRDRHCLDRGKNYSHDYKTEIALIKPVKIKQNSNILRNRSTYSKPLRIKSSYASFTNPDNFVKASIKDFYNEQSYSQNKLETSLQLRYASQESRSRTSFPVPHRKAYRSPLSPSCSHYE